MMKDETLDRYRKRILNVLEYIERNMHREFALDELANLGGFSKYHFTTVFETLFEESPISYIRRLRLEYGAFQILLNDDTITDIAINAGYETNAAFSKAFKKKFSVSPRKFLKIYQSSYNYCQIAHPAVAVFPDSRLIFLKKIAELKENPNQIWTKFIQEKQKNDISSKYNLLGRRLYRVAMIFNNTYDPDNKIFYDFNLQYRNHKMVIYNDQTNISINPSDQAAFLFLGSGGLTITQC